MRARNESERRLRKAVLRSHLARERYKAKTEELDCEKRSSDSEVMRLMNELGVEKYTFEESGDVSGAYADKPTEFSCSIVSKKSVVYDAKRIYKRIGRENGGAVVKKEYKVLDMPKLIQLLKKHGVNPKEFKRLIDVSYSLDKSKLERLYELGYVSKDDLKGCYEVKTSKPYLQVKAKRIVQ